MKNFLRFRNEEGRMNKKWFTLSFIFLGIASTIWFLIRVIPKPQRAGYPCMRTAAPIMSGFVIYLISLGGSVLFFRKAFSSFKKAKYWSATTAIAISLVLVAIFNLNDVKTIYANVFGVQFTRGVLPDAPNTPMGTGWGIYPGRVAWTFSRNATNENCTNDITSDAYFMAKNNNQDTINKLANKAVIMIGGKSTVKDSWDAIFKSFNLKKKGTETGYVAGQKIFIKINNGQAGWAINSQTLAETGNTGGGVGNAMSNTSPQAVLAFIKQLVDSCGVAQGDIIIGEPMTHVYKSMYDIIHPIYPSVILIDKQDKTSVGRTTSAGWKSDAIIFSDKGKVMTGAIKDDMMLEMYNADYLINISALKAHARSGVTFSAKNHFGSSTHGKTYSAGNLHVGSINVSSMSSAGGGNDNLTNARGDYHMYRVLTDLMGHEKLGRNTVLFVVDGLWGGVEATDMPVKWAMAPFNNDWPSSLFVSQDEIAMQSVCLDFLRAEADKNTTFKDRPYFPAVDDFLHQGASIANWPDSIINTSKKWFPFAGYDPEGDGTLMPSSLGVHEHWNDAINKQYTRNLFANGTGIELVTYPANLVAKSSATAFVVTFVVSTDGSPLQDAIVIVNGSNYLTNSEGKAAVGNFKTTSGLSYLIKKTGYTEVTGQVDVSANVEVSKELTKPGVVGVKNTVEKGYTLSVFPNPCVSTCEFGYQLKTSANVTIYVINLEGKIVQQVKQGRFAAGNYNENINVENLRNGIYIGVLKINSETNTIKFQVKK
jgi:hypothetical protein